MKMRVFLAVLVVVAAGYMTGCTPVRHNLPPAQQLLEPGPGVGGPGPGVLGGADVVAASAEMAMGGGDGCVACSGGGGMGMGMGMGGGPSVQVLFSKPEGMQVLYDIVGDGSFTSEPLYVPGRVEFPQGGIYRLKLTNIPNREGVELYPTIEVANGNPRTGAFLAHSAIPIQFSPNDFEQVLTGNFVTKVIYMPDPEFQGEAIAGVEELVANRTEAGQDPIVEADRRGSILAIIRMGNKDIELAGAGAGMAMAGGPGICGPDGCMVGAPASLPGYVAGMTAPQYGMTYTGTPIGLPGPPHIPLGSPAGLKRHTISNHTRTHLPDPVQNVKIHVRQTPGISYPQPASRAYIHEQNIHAGNPTGMPAALRHSQSVPAQEAGYCPPQ